MAHAGPSGERTYPVSELSLLTSSTSTISESNASSTWALEYAPETSQKFKLWNTAANCYLATSYRSFLDWDGVYANDTVLRGLNLELEATCLSDAAASASKWEIVDGKSLVSYSIPYGSDNSIHRLPRVCNQAAGKESYDTMVTMAMETNSVSIRTFRGKSRSVCQIPFPRGLQLTHPCSKRFRQNYGYLQDTPVFLLDREPFLKTHTWLPTYAASSFVLFYLVRAVLHKRGMNS